ncbi:MAG: type I glyceraldehyde-3-phosphate dehydrogenase [Patescibacteria group bacterium]|jgi:glyceraldehyde 3-phosphate dehydrogenase
MNIAINGFGRIGRAAFKAVLAKNNLNIKIVGINDLTDVKTLAHLLKYDSAYKIYNKSVEHDEKGLIIDGKHYPVFAQKDPKELPWKDLEVDLVIESTGIFRTKEKASAHLEAGAKKVVISAPAKDDGDMKTIVLGVNEEDLKADDDIFSMASCTTNCLAPMTKVIEDNFGIEKALMTTTHSYTADQVLVDGPHKDLRRARSAAVNIIPTSTGAALATGLVIPSLSGKFDGLSLRVPTPVVSICDAVYVLKKDVTAEEVNEAIKKACEKEELKGILTYSDEPLVSSDYVGNPYSSIVDIEYTMVVGGNLLKMISWYDNEWGYSNRLVDVAEYIEKNNLI